MRKQWSTIAAAAFLAMGTSLAYRAAREAGAQLPVASHEVVEPNYLGKLRFLALGDSYTIGEQVKVKDRWPKQLAAKVRSSGVDLSDPIIIARTGWTTGDLLLAMDHANIESNFDLVMLLIGVNNQFQRRSSDEYRKQFAQLLGRSIAAAKGNAMHVIVLSIPDWGVMPFAEGADRKQIGSQIDAFNGIAKQECDAVHIKWIDITAVSREASTQPTLIAGDGLHPSGPQYLKWSTVAAPVVCRSIGSSLQDH